MGIRRLAPVALVLCAVLAGCGGNGSASPRVGASPEPDGLSDGDVETCTAFIAGEDRVVEFLTLVEETGSIYEDPEGQSLLLALADRARPYLELAEHPDLVLAVQRLVELDDEARRAVVSGLLDPEPHLGWLTSAANRCEFEGVAIDWRD